MAVRNYTRREPQFYVPRYVSDLNELAAAHGFEVTLRCDGPPSSWGDGFQQYDWFKEPSIFVAWKGPRKSLFELNLLRPSFHIPQTVGWIAFGTDSKPRWVDRDRPYLCGFIEPQGNEVYLELYAGRRPTTVISAGAVEVSNFHGEVAYHGTAEHLFAQRILDPCNIPSSKRYRKDFNPHCGPELADHTPRWTTRRQPDGSYVHFIETDAAFQRRREIERTVSVRTSAPSASGPGSAREAPKPLDSVAKYRAALAFMLFNAPANMLKEMTDRSDQLNRFTLPAETIEQIQDNLNEILWAVRDTGVLPIRRDTRSTEEKEAARESVVKAQRDSDFQRFLSQLRPPAGT